MRPSIILLSLIVFAGCQQSPTGLQPLTEADMEQVTALREAEVKAILAGDASAYAALYVDDAISMGPNRKMVRGKAEIQKEFQGFVDQGAKSHEHTLTPVEIYGVGGLAYFRLQFTYYLG